MYVLISPSSLSFSNYLLSLLYILFIDIIKRRIIHCVCDSNSDLSDDIVLYRKHSNVRKLNLSLTSSIYKRKVASSNEILAVLCLYTTAY